MPFVEKSHRDKPDLTVPGDRCFVHYQMMMNEWKKSPRWTTIDELAKQLFPDDNQRAYFLAFLVHFNFIAIPYERKKEAENGVIE